MGLIHFVTNRCNAKCAHCFHGYGREVEQTARTGLFSHPGDAELRLDELEQLARHLGPCLFNVNLSGGEPFLREDLEAIGRAYLGLGGAASLFVSTNGSFPERALSLARMVAVEYPDRVLFLSISLDDLPERHDRARGIPGLFENALATYHRAREVASNVRCLINLTVSEYNYRSAAAAYHHLIRDCGVRNLTLGMARNEGFYTASKGLEAEVLATLEAVQGFLRKDRRAGRLESPSEASGLLATMHEAKNRLQTQFLENQRRQPGYVLACRAAALFGILGPSGEVFPCELVPRSLGNVRDYYYEFIDLWHDSKAEAMRTWIATTRCHCTYECAWTYNLLADWGCLGAMAGLGLCTRIGRPRTDG